MRLYTIPQTADRLGYSREHVYRLIRSGQLVAVRNGEGAHWRVTDTALSDFVRALDSSVQGRRHTAA